MACAAPISRLLNCLPSSMSIFSRSSVDSEKLLSATSGTVSTKIEKVLEELTIKWHICETQIKQRQPFVRVNGKINAAVVAEIKGFLVERKGYERRMQLLNNQLDSVRASKDRVTDLETSLETMKHTEQAGKTLATMMKRVGTADEIMERRDQTELTFEQSNTIIEAISTPLSTASSSLGLPMDMLDPDIDDELDQILSGEYTEKLLMVAPDRSMQPDSPYSTPPIHQHPISSHPTPILLN